MGPTPPTPRTIGPYELLGELGRGGMGRVVRGRHRETGAVHAVKILDSLDAEARLRFAREGEALGALSGDGVVPVHGAGEDRGQAWLAMSLLPGGTLRERLKTAGRLPWAEAAVLVARLARALARCHAAGVVHRDVKPENVLFDEGGAPQLADFGLVRADSAAALTVTGQALGTPSYMAPEQLDGQRVGPPADVWSLGVVLHELVTGERPYRGTTMTAVLAAIVAGQRRPWEASGAPRLLERIVGRALEVEPEGRLDAAALAEVLDGLVEGDGQAARRLRRLLSALGLVAALAVLALGLAVAAQARRRQLEREATARAALQLAAEARATALGADLSRLDAALAAVDSWSASARAGRLGLPPASDLALLEAALADVGSRVQALEAAAPRAARERAVRTTALARADLAVARLDAGAAAAALQPLAPDDPERRLLELVAAPPGQAGAGAAELAAIASAAALRGDARLAFEARWAASRDAMWLARQVLPEAWVPLRSGPDPELGRAAMRELRGECLVLGPRATIPSSSEGRPHPHGLRFAAMLEEGEQGRAFGVGMARGLARDPGLTPAVALGDLTFLEGARPGVLAAAALGPRPLALAERALEQGDLATAALGAEVVWAAAGDGPGAAEEREAAGRLAVKVRGQLRAAGLANKPREVAAHVVARLRVGDLAEPVSLHPRPDDVVHELILLSSCDWASREPIALLAASYWFARFQRAPFAGEKRQLLDDVLAQAGALAADLRRPPWERASARLVASDVLLLLEREAEARAQLEAALPDAGDPDDVRQRIVSTCLQLGVPGVEDAMRCIQGMSWPAPGTSPRAIAWLRYSELAYCAYHYAVIERYSQALEPVRARLARIPAASGTCRAIDEVLDRFRARK